MRITWESDSGGAFLVGDNTGDLRGNDSRVVNAVVPSFQQAVDDAVLLGSESRGLEARGNWAISIAVQCTYQFSSIDECRLFVCDLPTHFAGNGLLRLQFEGGSQRILSGVVCERIGIDADIGQVAVVTYNFRGETLTA